MTVRYRAPRGPSPPLRTDTPPMRAACAQDRVCARRIRVERAHLTLSGQLPQGPAAAAGSPRPRPEPAAAHRAVPRSTPAPPSPPAAATVALLRGAPHAPPPPRRAGYSVTPRAWVRAGWVGEGAGASGGNPCTPWEGHVVGRVSASSSLSLSTKVRSSLSAGAGAATARVHLSAAACLIGVRLSPGPDVHLSLPACASRYTGVHIRSGPVPVCLDGESDSEAAAVVLARRCVWL